jgi:hypothetical protein
MRIIHPIAGILLGLIFGVRGLNGFLGFLWFLKAPPMTGPAGEFQTAITVSHFIWFTSGVQVIADFLLLINRYVVFAVFVLAAVLANILAYHITMMPSTVILAILTVAIWFVVAWPLRAYFSPLFVDKVTLPSR